MISSPLRSTPSASSSGSTVIIGENSIFDDGRNGTISPLASMRQSNYDSGNEKLASSPLKAAASLIQSLDIAQKEMKSFAADAAADAEKARRNARTAQEIARRYQNQSYPTIKLDELVLSTSAAESLAFFTAPSASSFTTTSRSKCDEIIRDHDNSLRQNPHWGDFEEQNGEQKEYEKDYNQKNIYDNNDDLGMYMTSPMASKPKETQDKASNSQQMKDLYRSPTSFERIAQHHADDVLQLTLELERTRQALKLEQRSHKDCQASLASVRSKKKKLESNTHKLVEKHKKEQEESRMEISKLEKELELYRLRVQAAEEDAQMALDLAKESAEQRDKIEESFQKGQKQIKMLKEHAERKRQLVTIESPKRNVHFADEDDNTMPDNSSSTISTVSKEKTPKAITTTRKKGPPRSMIAAGRQLLLRRNMSPHDAVIRLGVSPTKSAERRQQLYLRLNSHLNVADNEDANFMLLASLPSRTPFSPTQGNTTTAFEETAASSSTNTTITKSTLEEYHTAVKILQISGRRLDLNGYWWRDRSKAIQSQNSIQIDVMTRQYCQNVEFKIVRQQKDINQLESLCGYLEKKLFMDKGTNCS